jgi:hypothetical protein
MSNSNVLSERNVVSYDNLPSKKLNTVNANLGIAAAFLSFVAGGSWLGFKAEAPELFNADTTNQVQEDSKFDVLFNSMVEQPVPKFGLVFAEIESGKWHIVKVVKGQVLGKNYEFSLPATGRAVEFSKVPVKVETTGSDLGVYSWQKGEVNLSNNLRTVNVTVDPTKISHNVSFLEEGYSLKGSDTENSYIATINDPSTRIGDRLIEGPGDYAQALCNGAGKLLADNTPSWCQYLGGLSKATAIEDAKIENSGRQAALESVRKCLPTVWQQERTMIVNAIKEMVGTHLQYPKKTWDSNIVIKFKTNDMPDYTKSTNKYLAEKGILTEASLAQQGFVTDNSIEVSCKTVGELNLSGPGPATAEGVN